MLFAILVYLFRLLGIQHRFKSIKSEGFFFFSVGDYVGMLIDVIVVYKPFKKVIGYPIPIFSFDYPFSC